MVVDMEVGIPSPHEDGETNSNVAIISACRMEVEAVRRQTTTAALTCEFDYHAFLFSLSFF